MDFNQILIVCLGNICRSPMAEGFLRYQLMLKGSSTQVSSAGLEAVVGHAPSTYAKEVMKDEGIDITSYRARQLNQELVVAADLILVMEACHKHQIEKLYTYSCGRVHLLGKWRENQEIPDPWSKPKQQFVETLTLIKQGLQAWQF